MSLMKFSIWLKNLKRLVTRSSSLVLLFQRTPIIHYFLPEAGVLTSSSLVSTVPLAITTVAGLGAYDSVSGATTISQAAPVSGSNKIPSAQGLALNNVFNVVGAGGHTPKSWSIIGSLPAGLHLSNSVIRSKANSITGTPTATPGNYPITIKAWEKSGFSGRSASAAFTLSVLGFTTQPSSATIPSGTTTTLTCVVAGNPSGATLNYKWYEGSSGGGTPLPGATSASFTTAPLTTTKSFWVEVTSTLSPSVLTIKSETAVIDVASPSATVTLAISPTEVAEDATQPLTYTFSRTGPTTSPLTVNFNLTGTATLGDDFAQTGAATFDQNGGTITIPAGAESASVEILPIADSLVEIDETLALALATGDGYSSGTADTIVGTITNDDTPLSEWLGALPPEQRDPLAAPQNDGVPNLLKFAFNLDPTIPDLRTVVVGAGDTAGLPCITRVEGHLRLEFLRRKAATNPGITYIPEAGSDLTHWNLPLVNEIVTPVGETDWERVTLDGPAELATAFARVRIIVTASS